MTKWQQLPTCQVTEWQCDNNYLHVKWQNDKVTTITYMSSAEWQCDNNYLYVKCRMTMWQQLHTCQVQNDNVTTITYMSSDRMTMWQQLHTCQVQNDNVTTTTYMSSAEWQCDNNYLHVKWQNDNVTTITYMSSDRMTMWQQLPTCQVTEWQCDNNYLHVKWQNDNVTTITYMSSDRMTKWQLRTCQSCLLQTVAVYELSSWHVDEKTFLALQVPLRASRARITYNACIPGHIQVNIHTGYIHR